MFHHFLHYLGLSLFLVAAPLLADTNLSIIHINDLHAHLLPSNKTGQDCISGPDCRGGVARLQTFIDTERAKNPNVLFLNAGDNFSGTFFYTFHKEADLIPLFNRLNFDAMTLGNHEFDDPPTVLENFLSHIPTPCINSHIHFPDNPILNNRLIPSLILTRGNLKIGIIGALTDDVITNSMHGDIIQIDPVIPTLKSEIDRLKSQGVSVLILLSHLGFYADMNLARHLPDVDIIVGGHTHTLLSNTQPTAEAHYPAVIEHPDHTRTLIVSSGHFGWFVGKLNATFNGSGDIISFSGDTIPLSDDIPADQKTSEFLATQSTDLDKQLNTTLHTLKYPILMTADKNYCAEECPIGSALTHMILSETPQADIVLLNSGAIRSELESGPVLQKHLIQVLPFTSTSTITTMTGSELKSYIESGLHDYHPGERINSLLQIAGADYTFSPKTKKIRHLTVHGQPVNLSQEYKIVMPLFLAKGGDRFPPKQHMALKKSLGVMIKDYLTKHTDIPTFPTTVHLTK